MVDAQSNVAKTFETALMNAWIAEGSPLLSAEILYDGFQVTNASTDTVERSFPQLQFGCSVDVPDGIEFNQESKTRTISGAAVVAHHIIDDPKRVALAAIFGKFRSMFETANADLSAWATAYLPAGYLVSAILIEDSPPPEMDDNYAVFGVTFRIEFTLP